MQKPRRSPFRIAVEASARFLAAATLVEVRRTTIVITRPKRKKILEPNPIFVIPKIKEVRGN